jgi:menaquinone-9 beta-reductase
MERLIGMSLVSTVAMNRIARVLARNKDMADLFVGVAGDFIPARAVLNSRFFFKLAFARGARA